MTDDVLAIIDHARTAVENGQNGEAYLALKDALGRLEEREGPKVSAPAKFLFGIDDPFGDESLYVWIVAEEFYRQEGCADDSSSAHSAVRANRFESEEDEDAFLDQVSIWLDQATNGILYGEAMESCWETGWITERDRRLQERLKTRIHDPYEGKTRDEAQEIIKAALVERGFVHEPGLEKVE